MPTARTTKKSAKSKKSPEKSKPAATNVAAPQPQPNRPPRLPSVWRLTKQTSVVLWQHRWLFLGIALIYSFLSLILVRGVESGTNVNDIKQQLTAVGGDVSQVAISLSVFATLLASSGNGTNATAGATQSILMIIISLATIWALREIFARRPVRLRDAFYRGMYPLVPFVLVLLVVLLQTLPFAVGGWLFSFAITNGIAYYLPEKIVLGVVFAGLTVASLYLLCSSLFALYIVTLPDMTPMKALRSARELVRRRRLQVFRKLLYLPVALFVLLAAIIVPIIAIVPPLTPWVFFALSMCALVVVNTYIYTLYRELVG